MCKGYLPTQEDGESGIEGEHFNGFDRNDEELNNVGKPESLFYSLETESIKQEVSSPGSSTHTATNNEVRKQSTTEKSSEHGNDSSSANPHETLSRSRDPNRIHIPRETILHECLEYCNTFENDFEVDEIHRIAHLLRCYPQYSYISTFLPESWEAIIHEVMILGR